MTARSRRQEEDSSPDSESLAPPPERAWLFCLLSLVLVAALYASVLGGPFIWDDRLLVADSTAIRSLDVSRFFSQPFWLGAEGALRSAAYYRPLVTLSFALDYQVHGDNPGGYHLTNVALHLAATALVFSLLRRRAVGVSLSFVLATAWACLPRITEAAGWISGRADVLAGAFSLAAILVYRPRNTRRLLLAVLFACLGLLSKESGLAAIVALALLTWHDRTPDQRFPRLEWAAVGSALAAYALLRVRAGAFALETGHVLSLGTRGLTVLEALGRYAYMLLDPLQPRSFLGHLGRPTLPFVGLGALVLTLLVVVARRAQRAMAPQTRLFSSVGLVPLLLVLHVAPIPTPVVAADRYLYLPAAALLVAFAPAFERHAQRRAWLRALPLAMLVACGVRSFQRIGDYADEARFWIEAVREAPGEGLPLGELASVAYRAGCYPEALELYRSAIHLNDTRSEPALENAALLAGVLGDQQLAASLSDRLLRDFPSRPELELRRATVALTALDFNQARAHASKALALAPQYVPARRFLSLLSEMESDFAAIEGGTARPDVALRLALRTFRYPDAKARLKRRIEAPDATEAELRSGIEFFIAKGDPKDAKPLLERYVARGNVVDAERLEAALQERQRVADQLRQQLVAFQASGDLPQAQTK